jgi:hypothetical protein
MIIGLTGHKGSGKSTVAHILVEQYGYRRERFAGPPRDMLRAIGLTADHLDGHLKETPSALLAGRTPRHAMETLGTEWGRDLIHPHLWTTIWIRRVTPGTLVVADDVRFESEELAVRSLGGVVWRINRDGHEADAHRSTHYIDEMDVDGEIYNNLSVDDLAVMVRHMMRGLGLEPGEGSGQP